MDERLKETIVNELKEFHCKWIYIFGSFASGEETLDSDVDIAFFSLEKLDKFAVFEKAQMISSKIGREVDLIDLKDSSTVFQNQVVQKGMVIYDENPTERESFEITVLKKYMELNSLRKDIIHNYEESLDDFVENLKRKR